MSVLFLKRTHTKASIPETVFADLQATFRITFECFASPLNAYLPNFCSAFPDTDLAFGSCGSFFNFEPREGSFQVHPPASEEVMLAAADHVLKLLEHPEAGALSFVCIMPLWEDPPTLGLQRLTEVFCYPSHLQLHLNLSLGERTFAPCSYSYSR